MSVLSNKRKDRLSEAIRKELSLILYREVHNPDLKSLTVTGVEIDPEMRTAKVKVCRMMTGEFREPSLSERRAVEKALSRARGFIFERLRKSLSLRFIPELSFQYDPSVPEASYVWAKMNDWVRKENKPCP
ncbi:MAG: 30S ribosome-binding factor RbfA [Bradymonadales bacterium]|nr:MAG: 30S ribosome-binding factor RbfA [Bradymonadales bacterium]